MYICEYCNRHLKKKYDKCPACGGKSFKKVQNYGEEIIKTPPQDGYKVNVQNFKFHKKANSGGLIVGIYIVIVALVVCLPFIFVRSFMGDESDDAFTRIFFLIFAIFGIIAFISALKSSNAFFGASKKAIKGANTDIKRIEYLSKHGMLIKNLKYTIKPVKGMIQGNKTVYQIQVIYEIEKGKTKNFLSEPKYLTALGRDDGTVDLLIDPNDYTNYFIDFEIY